MAKRWELTSLLHGVRLTDIYHGTPWAEIAQFTEENVEQAQRGQDRAFFDAEVPLAMVVYGLAVTGSVVYRSSDQSLRTWAFNEDAEPVPLAWVAARYGAVVAEELIEKSIMMAHHLRDGA